MNVSNKVYCIPRVEWEAMWAQLRTATQNCGLNEAAMRCEKIKAAWARQYPDVPFSAWGNGRYESQVERALERGHPVSNERIAEITDDDLRYDRMAFPNVNARRKELATV